MSTLAESPAGAPYHRVPHEMAELAESLRKTLVQAEVVWPKLSKPERAIRLALILAAFIGRFIRIHPFINGNGRLSRLIWCWGLLRFGVAAQCRVHPRSGSPYSDIMEASMKGDDGPLAACILSHLAHHPPSIS
ncbi:MAG: Fic family protein [Planctomycetes bacterium]|nr:Fic family protein [Planctomycetota bacterium]